MKRQEQPLADRFRNGTSSIGNGYFHLSRVTPASYPDRLVRRAMCKRISQQVLDQLANAARIKLRQLGQ